MSLAMKLGKRLKVRITFGQEPAEMGQPGGQAGDSLCPADARFSLEIGDEGVLQIWMAAEKAEIEGVRLASGFRRFGHDAEMK